MEKCRICLNYRKNLRSVFDAEDGTTFISMISSFSNLKIRSEPNIPNKLCLFCRKRLKEAYNFKIVIEKSEIVLNETAKLKIISFTNIQDVRIDYKPLVPTLESTSKKLFENEEETVTYNETVIKRIKGNKQHVEEKQITVKEFLNSFNMESDNEPYDYEVDVEYDPQSDSDYEYEKQLKTKKIQKQKDVTNRRNEPKTHTLLIKPIRPRNIKDVVIKHKSVKLNIPKPRKKYLRKTGVCPYCGKILFCNYLDTHILSHSGERPFKCDQCPKSFLSANILNQHKKLHTMNMKEYKCDQCIATFVNKSRLEIHRIVHSEEKNYICDICSKGFKRKCTLLRHLLVHNFGKKAVQCELCPKTFNSKFFLNHHMRVHTGERPYKCELCSQPYSYKHDFNRHCLKKHGIFLKRRSVNILNEEVLQQEKALMRELALRVHGVIQADDIPSIFSGPQGLLAFQQAMKAVESRLVPVTYTE